MQVGDLVKCTHRYSDARERVQLDDACLVLGFDIDDDPYIYVLRTSYRLLDYKSRYAVISKAHNESR